MRIIIDAFGGDKCPDAPVKAAISAVKKHDLSITLVGDEKLLKDLLCAYGCTDKRISIVHAPDIITNFEKPVEAVRHKKNSSVVVGAELLARGDGDAFVSAGNTGAVLAASLFNIGRIKGIRRPALAVLLPSVNGKTLLLDCGANTCCKPCDLYNFALMGNAYMQKIENILNPAVALLSNGTEAGKGDALVQEVYPMLCESDLNFVGNVEGRDINLGNADVIICDGFSGNIALKAVEGSAKLITQQLKEILLKNKLVALLLKNKIKKLTSQFDYKAYGGAVLLGIKKPVIKAHGSSDENSFEAAINQAVQWVLTDADSYIENMIKNIDVSM